MPNVEHIECRHCHRPPSYEVDGYRYCEQHFYDHYITCYYCNECIHNEDSRYNEGNCETYCIDCYPYDEEEDEDDYSLIKSYGYQHELRYKAAPDDVTNPQFYGFELEVEYTRDGNINHERVVKELDALGGLNFTHDGSLDNGFEIKGHPMTLNYIKGPFKDTLTKTVTILSEEGYSSYDTKTCGFHIHIGKATLTDDTLIKMTHLLNTNLQLVQLIGQRRLNGYCSPSDIEYERLCKGRFPQNRGLINFGNHHTVELRFFKGTLHLPTILSYFEAADLLVKYCSRPLAIELMDVQSFLYFLDEHKTSYPNLHARLQRRIKTLGGREALHSVPYKYFTLPDVTKNYREISPNNGVSIPINIAPATIEEQPLMEEQTECAY